MAGVILRFIAIILSAYYYFSNYLAGVVILEIIYLSGGELRWNIFACMQIFHVTATVCGYGFDSHLGHHPSAKRTLGFRVQFPEVPEAW